MLEELIRDVAAKGVEITLTGVTANETDGFSGCVYRYPSAPAGDKLVNKRDPDPVAALRAALVDYLRFEADERRRYEQAPKYVAPVDDLEDLLG